MKESMLLTGACIIMGLRQVGQVALGLDIFHLLMHSLQNKWPQIRLTDSASSSAANGTLKIAFKDLIHHHFRSKRKRYLFVKVKQIFM